MSTHEDIWAEYTDLVNRNTWLKEHRDWVERNNWGYGDRPLHWMWYQLLQKIPPESHLMEIGVYRGQILSLWGLIGKTLGKNFSIFGITPLDSTGDKYGHHPGHDYRRDIQKIHTRFKLRYPKIIQGLSTDPSLIDRCKKLKLQVLYIDGGHDEKTIRSDIRNYAPLVVPGGFLVFDDASCSISMPMWRGLEDVSKVVDELDETDSRFETYQVVGHNRIFRRRNEN